MTPNLDHIKTHDMKKLILFTSLIVIISTCTQCSSDDDLRFTNLSNDSTENLNQILSTDSIAYDTVKDYSNDPPKDKDPYIKSHTP